MKINRVNIKLNARSIASVSSKVQQSLVETADALKSDLMQSETMPFDTGELQNRSTYVDDSKKKSNKVSIVSDTPYARRVYFHPEYKFQTTKNANAGGLWFDTYVDGKKKNYVKNTFAKIMRGKL